jgi:hypothetical protein
MSYSGADPNAPITSLDAKGYAAQGEGWSTRPRADVNVGTWGSGNSFFGNVGQGLRQGPSGLASTYKDPSLTYGDKTTRMVAELAAGGSKTLGAVGQGLNTYDQLSQSLGVLSQRNASVRAKNEKTVAETPKPPKYGSMFNMLESNPGQAVGGIQGLAKLISEMSA